MVQLIRINTCQVPKTVSIFDEGIYSNDDLMDFSFESLSLPITWLKLLSLFTVWLFWTFHNKSHNMKALVILSHSRSPFLPLTCLYIEKMNFCGSLCGLLEYFFEKNLFPNYPCKSHDHDHWYRITVNCPVNRQSIAL